VYAKDGDTLSSLIGSYFVNIPSFRELIINRESKSASIEVEIDLFLAVIIENLVLL
jgi:hypothetical protein